MHVRAVVDYVAPFLSFAIEYLRENEKVHGTGTVSQDFQPLFLLNRFDIGPKLTGKNVFANFLVFAKIFDCKVQKSCRVVNDYMDTQIFL